MATGPGTWGSQFILNISKARLTLRQETARDRPVPGDFDFRLQT